jgi:hypothetical protein
MGMPVAIFANCGVESNRSPRHCHDVNECKPGRLPDPLGHQWHGGNTHQEKHQYAKNIIERSKRLRHQIFKIFNCLFSFGLRISRPIVRYRRQSV